MEATLWQAGRLSGIVFVVLFVVGVTMGGDAGLDDGEEIAGYFADHRKEILIGNQLAAIGLVAFVLWGWWLMTVVEEASPESRLGPLILAAAVLAAAVEFPVMGLSMILAFISDQPVSADTARMMVNGAAVFSYLNFLPVALFLVAFGLAVRRTTMLGAWAAWTALMLAAVSVVGAAPQLGLAFRSRSSR